MKKNSHVVLFCMVVMLCLNVFPGWAQDFMPASAPFDKRIKLVKPMHVYKSIPDTIAIEIRYPDSFRETISNRILDESKSLNPIMERLYRLRIGVSEDTLRIVHIGDSHVRGRFYPRAVEVKLAETFGAISYTDMGVNGATCLTFTHPDRIAAIVELQPELLILSFGTNESHNRRYNATVHYHQMDELVKLLRLHLPNIPILLTTPPGSYESFRKRGQRRTYSINPRTETAVNTICRYGKTNKLAVWDMYHIVGGKDRACKNWWEAGLMRPDHVHYIADGYVLQGELLFAGLINTYNKYVFD